EAKRASVSGQVKRETSRRSSTAKKCKGAYMAATLITAVSRSTPRPGTYVSNPGLGKQSGRGDFALAKRGRLTYFPPREVFRDTAVMRVAASYAPLHLQAVEAAHDPS